MLALFDRLPIDTDVRLRLISICAAAGDLAQAKARCESLLNDEPSNTRAKRWLADVLSWNREYAASLKLFQELIQLDPENIDLKIRAAETTLWSKDPARALAMFQALPEKTLEQASIRRAMIDAAAANAAPLPAPAARRLVAIAEKALTPNDALRDDAVRLARLGGILARLNEKALAGRALERALSLDPKENAVRLELGCALQAADLNIDALRIYDDMILDGDDRFRRIEVLAALKRFTQARDECVAILRTQPGSRVASRWLADLLSWNGEYAESLRRFDELSRETPDDPELALRIAEVTLWSGDFVKAALRFQTLGDKAFQAVRVRRAYIDAAAGCSTTAATKLDINQLVSVAERSLAATDELTTDATYLSRLALCLHRAGRKEEFTRVLNRAMALQPTDPAVRFELGGVLVAAGRFADAFRLYDGLPLEGINRFRLIDLYAARGDWETALRDARALLARNPEDVESKRRLADLLSWKKDYAESIRLFEELVVARPNDFAIRQRLAEVALWSGDHAKALRSFNSLPDEVRSSSAFGRGYIDAAAGMDPASSPAINRTITRDVFQTMLRDQDSALNDPCFLGRLGVVLHRVGETDLAVRALEMAEKLPLGDDAKKVELAGAFVAAGLYAKAAQLYEGMNLQGVYRFRRLEMLAAQKLWDAALTESKRLIAIDGSDKQARLWQADIASWNGNYPEALEQFQELIRRDPVDIDLRIRLAEVYLWSKDYSSSLGVLVNLPETALSRLEVRRGFIDSASANGKLLDRAAIVRAQAIAKWTLDAPPNEEIRSSVSYLSRLAWVLLKGSDRELADKLLSAAMALKPKEPADRKELGGVLAAAERVAEAFQMYEGLTLEGDDRFRIIGLYSASRDFGHAEEECRKILRTEAGNRLARHWLADVLSWKGMHEESLRLFHELQILEPTNAEIPVRIAEVTLWSGDAAAALPLFAGLLAKEFDRPRLWEGFVAAAAVVPALNKEQLNLITRIRGVAKQTEIKSAPFWSRLAWIVYREHGESEAGAYLDQAIALKPTTANERREIAGVLSAFKRYKEAAAFYDFPLTVDDRLRLAEISAAMQDFPSAIAQIKLLLQERPNDLKALRYLADILSWDKQYVASLELFERLLKQSPADAELKLHEPRCDSGAAITKLRFLISNNSSCPARKKLEYGKDLSTPPRVRPRRVSVDQTNIATQIAVGLDLNDKLKTSARDPLFLARLALVLHRSGQTALRDKFIERIGKKLPEAPAARRELAGIFLTLGASAQARELYASIAAEPEDQLRLIDLNTSEKQFAEAEKIARDLLLADPKNKAATRKLASVLAARNKHKEAVDLLKQIEKANPGDPDLEGDLALAVLWSGGYAEALQRLEPLLAKRLEPRLVEGYLDAAAMVKTFGQITQRKQVLAIYAQLPELKLPPVKIRQMAWVLRRVGEKQKAANLLESLIAVDASSRDIRLELAQTLDDLGKADEAAKHYRILLRSTP